MAINLSEYSIRYPEFPKYIWDSPTPYSDLMQAKKDRRNPDHTKRPLNAFMLFAKIQRDSITANFSCNHSEISKALGKLWQELSKEEKDPFIRGGKTLVELHRLEYPDYKYRPRKKGQAKDAAPKPAVAAKKSGGRTKVARPAPEPQIYGMMAAPSSPLSPPELAYPGGVASPLSPEQLYLAGGGSPAARSASPFSSYGSLSPGGSSMASMASPASIQHTPHSPVPSIGSSSGYESEMSSCLLVQEVLVKPEPECWSPEPVQWSPEPEPDISSDLRDLDVTSFDVSSLLNPLAMFPVLDLCSDDLEDLPLDL